MNQRTWNSKHAWVEIFDKISLKYMVTTEIKSRSSYSEGILQEKYFEKFRKI